MSQQPSTPSFSDWYRTSAPGLRGFAVVVAHDLDAGDEAFADAMSRCWTQWGKVPADKFAAYCRRAIVNSVISTARRASRVTPVAYLDPPANVDHADLVQADAAWEVCEGLPPQQRAALVLRFQYDQSYTQIAETLGCAEPTVRSHVRHGLNRLRTHLEETAHDHA